MQTHFTDPLSSIPSDAFKLVQKKYEMAVGHYILDDVKYPTEHINEDPVLLSYALSWCNAKTYITIRRPVCDLSIFSIGGEQKVLLSGERKVTSSAEAVVALYDTWVDLLSGVKLNAERIPDLTEQRNIWLNFLETKVGMEIENSELAQIVIVLHAFHSDLVPAAISETIQSPEMNDSLNPAIQSTMRTTTI